MTTSAAYLFCYGEAISGALSLGGNITDIGLGIWGETLSGSMMDGGEAYDAALLVRGETLSGALGESELEEDVIFTVQNIYGESFSGSLGDARVFLEQSVPSLNRYLPEGQST